MALNQKQLKRVEDEIKADIDRGDYDGVHMIVAQHGEIELETVYGYAERATERPLKEDDIFRPLSLSKGYTNGLIYRALGEGKLTLGTRVIDVIPEFLGTNQFHMLRKDQINLGHLLTHRSGMPATPLPGVDQDRMADLSAVIEGLGSVDVIHDPGTRVNYSPAINHALMGEMARRVYGYGSFAKLAQDLIFEPLGMRDTAFGLPVDKRDRAVPIKVYLEGGFLRPEDIEVFNDLIDENAEMPWVGSTTTARDVFAWVELLRRKGELDGDYLISPKVIERAGRIHTGELMNDLYGMVNHERGWELPKGNIGLGVIVNGDGIAPNFFGPFTSPNAYGNNGAGSTLYWIDPDNDVTFTFLSAGVLDEGDNVERFLKISSMVSAAIVS